MKTLALPFVVVCLLGSIAAVLLAPTGVQVWAMASSMICILLIPSTSRPVSTALAARLRPLLGLGVGLAVLSLALIVGGVQFWPNHDSERVIGLSVWPMLLGIAIGYTPFLSRNLNRARADIEASGAVTSGSASVPLARVRGDVAAAFHLLLDERGTVGWIAGPWFLIFCALPLAFLDVGLLTRLSHQYPLVALVLLILLLIAWGALPLIASIQWARHIATGQRPKLFEVPIGPLWGFLWRLFLAGVVLRAVSAAEPWLQSQLPGAQPWLVSGLSGLFSLLLLVVVSPWAMVLVAVALGSEDRSTYSALRAARGTGHGFYLGMLLILAPITLLWWLVGLAPAAQGQGLGAWLGYFVSALAVFLTLIVATTYLTGLYLRRQDATPV
ncbi:MAG TPA: hypothetical protein VHW05_09305 [Phenylobacterium sp.]|nr:hypothetical protein [Phenylobacterium sp.]